MVWGAYLEWDEPIEVARARNQLKWRDQTRFLIRRIAIWISLLAIAGAAVIYFVPSEDSSPIRQAFIAALRVFTIGGFFALLLYLPYRFPSTKVALIRRGILLNSSGGAATIGYRYVDSITFDSLAIGNQHFNVMVIRMKRGSVRYYGIPHQISVGEITDVLKERGVRIIDGEEKGN